jgi:Cu+-exporting ATPase
LYLRNAQTIEEMAEATHLVFDKTGTLTTTEEQDITYNGENFNDEIAGSIAAVAAQSTHPLSKLLARELRNDTVYEVRQFSETTGRGISGIVNHRIITLGSAEFVTGEEVTVFNGSSVYVSVDGVLLGHFHIRNHYRASIFNQIRQLSKQYRISVLSGDNEGERLNLQQELGMDVKLFFNQQPHDKLNYIKGLQQQGQKVIMIGDGLNDAGALKQSDAGIALTESTNNFTPASDGILEADRLNQLSNYLRFTKANKQVVIASFILSIVYNIIGLTFALQGILSPLVAAILMPSSSLSIILLTFGASSLYSRYLRLN